MTSKPTFFHLLAILCLVMLFSCNRTDESFPDVSNIMIELYPNDGQGFVPTHSRVYATMHKIRHEHSNDLGLAKLRLYLSLSANNQNIEGDVQMIKGDDVDTLVFISAEPLPTQQEIEAVFQAYWKIEEHSSHGESAYVTHLFETVPSTLPHSCLKVIYPESASADISVLAQPSIEFIYPLNKELIIAGDTYKYVFNEIELTNADASIDGNLVWNSDKDQLIFEPNIPLPTNAQINIEIETQLLIKANGKWQEAEASKKETIAFTTSTESLGIVFTAEEIESSYPVNRQYNFHKDEFDKGYVKMKTSYSWLDDEAASYSVMYYDQSGLIATKTTNYSKENRWFEYELPNNLENNTIYKIELVRKAKSASDIIYQYNFKTSSFNTFSGKMASFTTKANYIDQIYTSGVYQMAASLGGEEHFDAFELEKRAFEIGDFTLHKSTGLIRCVANTDDEWYSHKMIESVYAVLESGDMTLNYRDGQFFSIPPTEAVYLSCASQIDRKLTEAEISSNQIIAYEGDLLSTKLLYGQSLIMEKDYYELQYRILNDIPERQRTDAMEFILLHPFPSILGANDYAISAKLNYTIPCVEYISSTVEVVVRD